MVIKKVILFSYIFIAWIFHGSKLFAQWDIASFYSFVPTSDNFTKDLRPVSLYEHYINLSGRRNSTAEPMLGWTYPI